MTRPLAPASAVRLPPEAADEYPRPRTARMRATFQEELEQLEAGAPGGGCARPARPALRAERARTRRRRARRRGDRLRRRDRPPLRRHRGGRAVAAGPADAGGGRPPARAGRSSHQSPSRADGGLLRHSREADEADGKARRERRGDSQLARGHGAAGGADDPRRTRRLRRSRPREGAVAPRARRADRPREPPRHRGRALARRLSGRARVWSAHARRLALRRTHRRSRRRHRRADRVPRDRRLSRAH